MTEAQRRALLASSVQSALAVQRKILDAGDAIEPEWRRLGWEVVDSALDALLDALPAEPLEDRWRRLAVTSRIRTPTARGKARRRLVGAS